MTRLSRLALVLAVVAQFGPAGPAAADGLDVFIEAELKKRGVPGLSLAVIEGGQIVRARGYGVVEKGSSTPITPRTLFQAGSISKPVAAVAALRLVEQGRLALDEDVNARLKSWKVPDNAHTAEKKVTLRGLLSHGAGLTVHGFPGYAPGTSIPTLPQVLNGEKPANTTPVRVDLVPGSRWRYSGGGYTVAQLLMEDVTGQPFPAFMRTAVLEPLGMTESTYEQPLPGARRTLAAAGHNPVGRVIPGRWHVYPEMAAAGLWTTPSDLARFAIGVQDAYAGKAGSVLSRPTARQMLTPQTESWGLGPALEGTGPELRFGHGGRDEGFDAELVAYAEGGRGAVVMINANENRNLLRRVLEAIAREYRWPGFPIRPDYRPIPDDAPELAARVKQIYRDLQQGKMDRGLFTSEFAERLAPVLAQRAEFYRGLGTLGSVVLVERRDEGTDRLHRYRMAFREWNMLVAVRLDRDGKIAGLAAEPE